jgi:hypothetical protein
MPIQVACSSCSRQFNAPDSAAGKKAKCPNCHGTIEIPSTLPVDEVFDAEEEPAGLGDVAEYAVAAPTAVAVADVHKPCPKCRKLIQQAAVKCRFCGEIFDPVLMAYAVQNTRPFDSDQPDIDLFLRISITRLVLMSVLSFGLYEVYWIYKNWRYLKERGDLNIWPFWRGFFGIFFCHSLLRDIHEDPVVGRIQTPTFSPGGLATGWVVLRIFGNLVSRASGVESLFVAALVPSYLFFVPVQKHVNAISARRNPSGPYYRWSTGHFVCLAYGVILWMIVILGMIGSHRAR